jgi:hypothetical protein
MDNNAVVDAYFDTVLVETNQLLTVYNINDYPYTDTLPSEGWVEIGDVYSYENENVVIIQSHDRITVNHFDPHDVPALYLFMDVTVECPEWIQPIGAQDVYNIGDCVTVGSYRYISNIDNNTTNPELFNDEDSPWNYWDKEPFEE